MTLEAEKFNLLCLQDSIGYVEDLKKKLDNAVGGIDVALSNGNRLTASEVARLHAMNEALRNFEDMCEEMVEEMGRIIKPDGVVALLEYVESGAHHEKILVAPCLCLVDGLLL